MKRLWNGLPDWLRDALLGLLYALLIGLILLLSGSGGGGFRYLSL